MGSEIHHSHQFLFRTEKHPAVTAATWAVCDRAGCDWVEYIVTKGIATSTVARVTVSLQSGTATSAHTVATTNEMIGTNGITLAATLAVGCRFLYIGSDRYTSVKVDPAQTNATGALSVVAIRANRHKQPITEGGTATKGFTSTFPATVGAPAI